MESAAEAGFTAPEERAKARQTKHVRRVRRVWLCFMSTSFGIYYAFYGLSHPVSRWQKEIGQLSVKDGNIRSREDGRTGSVRSFPPPTRPLKDRRKTREKKSKEVFTPVYGTGGSKAKENAVALSEVL
jgi:hypothetical protein